MANDQGQPESEPAVETADGTTALETSHEQAPASDNQPTTTPPPAPVERPKVSGVEDYEENLRKAMSPAAEAPVEEPGEPAATTEEPPVEGEEPPTDPAPAVTEPPLADRVRLNHLSKEDLAAQNAIVALTRGGMSLKEATSRVLGTDAPAVESTPPVVAEPVRSVEDVQTEIATLKADRKEAIRNLDPEKQIEIEDKLEALQAEHATIASQQAEQQSAEDQAFSSAVEASHAEAATYYPMVADPKHAIHAESQRIWATMEKTKNPIIYDENAPFTVYQMAANKLGIAPVDPESTPAPAAPLKSSPPATPKPQLLKQTAVSRPTPAITPASAGDRTTPPGPPAKAFANIRNPHDYDKTLESLR